MIQGLYSAAAGMTARIDQQDIISNNLANINTSGFKRKTVSFTSFEQALADAMPSSTSAKAPTAVLPSPIVSDDSRPGTLHETGVSTDLAIDGQGEFVVQSPTGEMLTRNGGFTLAADGKLVTREGYPVLGESGPITVPSTGWSVGADGTVRSNTGQVIDKLQIRNAGAAGTTRVLCGYKEGSNVNSVQEMVSMLSALRSYESCQKVIQSLDQTLDKAVNQMLR